MWKEAQSVVKTYRPVSCPKKTIATLKNSHKTSAILTKSQQNAAVQKNPHQNAAVQKKKITLFAGLITQNCNKCLFLQDCFSNEAAQLKKNLLRLKNTTNETGLNENLLEGLEEARVQSTTTEDN